MTNSQTLSLKPSIDEALRFLGMDGIDKAKGIQALLRISEIDCLPLFFDQLLTCVPTSIRYGDQYDDEYEFTETVFVNPEDEREFLSGHILDSFNFWEYPEGTLTITVSRVIHDDIAYFISYPDGTLSEGESVGYEKFYFDRNQLIQYKNEYSAALIQDKVEQRQSTVSKSPSIVEQRVMAFKYWLVGNSGKSIHNPTDLQVRYEEMESPTKHQVWSQLQLMDKTLFASGRDDSLKAMSKVVQFKIGTGKNRNN